MDTVLLHLPAKNHRHSYWRSFCVAVACVCLSLALSPADAAKTSVPAPPGTQAFGTAVRTLPNGNFLVLDPDYDLPGPIADVGAVFLFSANGTLISTLTGSTANDRIGTNTLAAGEPLLEVLATGDFVVRSPGWDNGAQQNAGAITWGDADTGVNGVVSAANSLVGSRTTDAVGGIFSMLEDGDYLAISPSWDNGAVVDAGAVTWCSGSVGCAGAVSAANSLVGAATNARVGSRYAIELSDGDFVVRSPDWTDGATAALGAVTWCSGVSGCTGTVSAANSLVGGTSGDRIGNQSVRALSNGHFVVSSPDWDSGGMDDVGAVTWGDGSGATVGAVSSTNSLVGPQQNDRVGIGGIVALNNGDYVAVSNRWSNGVVNAVGAVTRGSGNGGTTGFVSAANSLVGTTANDQVGSSGVVALNGGRYAVSSSNWDAPGLIDAGAVTWVDGAAGVTGAVSAANSLIGGHAADYVGSHQIVLLASGNFVVGSANWDSDSAAQVGAVTFCPGASACIGTVSASNSLVGSQANDLVGGDGVVALPSGNYVVVNSNWANATASSAGAVTWCNGTTGCTGAVSSLNSLVGSQSDDGVGNGGVQVLANGHYVVASPSWDQGGVADVGAITWGNANGGLVGPLSSGNSLVANRADVRLGNDGGIVPLSDGDYVVLCPDCDVGIIGQAGLAAWRDGDEPTSGAVELLPAVVGSRAGDISDDERAITPFSDGRYAVFAPNWDDAAELDAGALRLLAGDGSGAGEFLTPLDVTGLFENGGDRIDFDYDASAGRAVVGLPMQNKVILFDAPTPENEMSVAAGLVEVAADGQCSLIEAMLNANNNSQIGSVDCPAGSDNDVIVLAPGAVYTMTQVNMIDQSAGLPGVVDHLTLRGQGATLQRDLNLSCAIDGIQTAAEFRLLNVQDVALTIDNLILRNGCADGNGNAGDGGAIRVPPNAALILRHSTVETSQARDKSGGIDIGAPGSSSGAQVWILDSVIRNNTAGGGGGGIGHGGSRRLRVERSALLGNFSSGDGGGGLGSTGDALVANSTFFGNSTNGAGGGAIGNQGTLQLLHVTIYGNDSSGPLGGGGVGNAGTLQIKNSIVGSSATGGDCSNIGVIQTFGTNFDTDGSCEAAAEEFVTVTMAELGLPGNVADNGGATPTLALSPNSIAVDLANDCTAVDGLAAIGEDQRAVSRPFGNDCDVGAFELGTLLDEIFADGFE